MRTVLFLSLLVGACADVPQAFELDHARVMAVRVDPPALAPGERAGISVLVTDADAGPRVADTAAVRVTSPFDGLVARTEAGWEVTAPSSEQLAVARMQLGLADDADVIAPLALEVTFDGAAFTAQKTVAFGRRAENPVAPAISHDGAVGPCNFDAGRDIELSVTPVVDELSYRWFSSVGDVTGYTRAEASLEPLRGTTGAIGVVVRDQVGGTAWAFVPAAVAP